MGLSKSKSKKYDVAGLQSRVDGDGSTYGSIKSNARRDYLNVVNSEESDLDIINRHESREEKLIGIPKPTVEREIVERVNQSWEPKTNGKVATTGDGLGTKTVSAQRAANTDVNQRARSPDDDEIKVENVAEKNPEESVEESRLESNDVDDDERKEDVVNLECKSRKEELIEEFDSNLSGIEKNRSDFVHGMLMDQQKSSKPESQEPESIKSDELTENVMNSVIDELEAIATTQKDLLKIEQQESNVEVVRADVEEEHTQEEEENNNEVKTEEKMKSEGAAKHDPLDEIPEARHNVEEPHSTCSFKQDPLDDKVSSNLNLEAKFDSSDEQKTETPFIRQESTNGTKVDPLDEPEKLDVPPEPEEIRRQSLNGICNKIDPLDLPNQIDPLDEPTSTNYDVNGCIDEEIKDVAFLTDGERLAYLNTISEIHKDAAKLREAAELFEGRKDDVQCVYLNEMLLRCLLKLDSVTVSDVEVRRMKKRVSEYVQECMKLLDGRSTGSEGDIRVAF